MEFLCHVLPRKEATSPRSIWTVTTNQSCSTSFSQIRSWLVLQHVSDVFIERLHWSAQELEENKVRQFAAEIFDKNSTLIWGEFQGCGSCYPRRCSDSVAGHKAGMYTGAIFLLVRLVFMSLTQKRNIEEIFKKWSALIRIEEREVHILELQTSPGEGRTAFRMFLDHLKNVEAAKVLFIMFWVY